MMRKWKLEPWSGLPSRDIVDENGERVARVPCDVRGEITANGRKVLAASALLEALTAMLGACNTCAAPEPDPECLLCRAVRIYLEARALARGAA